jgi:hypothetical protein
VAGHLRLPAGRDGLGRCSLEHDRPGRVPLGLGLTMETTGFGSGLGPQQRVHGCAAGHELARPTRLHATSGVFILGHLAEEDEARPFQGLCDLDGVDDVVERCM